MNDKLVTHADLMTLRRLRNKDEHLREWSQKEIADTDALLDRLIAAAEADAPPLPEGWVLLSVAPHVQQVVWHKAGTLYRWSDCSSTVDDVEQVFDSLTPLRPTVTEADVEKAAIAYMSNGEDTEWEPGDSEEIKQHGRKAARLILAAAGIEVV